MTCAKHRVICILSDDSGSRVMIGENLCMNPQVTCPREEGEGYEKCETVCEQMGHAEEQALANWNSKWRDTPPTHAVIRGHERVCDNCAQILEDAGVTTLIIAEPSVPHCN